MLDWLQEWYKSQCDGDWEHSFGIKIETLDNPGWQIKIDLEDTDFNLEPIGWTFAEHSEDRWLGYKIVNNQFNGSCDPLHLDQLIRVFKMLTEGNNITETEIMASLQNSKA